MTGIEPPVGVRVCTAELLRTLLRFDTTNPPGAEAECVGFVQRLLREAGLETRLVARDPERPNLIARLRGRGQAPPLLMYGHADVVPTTGQVWKHPPFAAEMEDGFIYGRGALDMKGGIAMMLAAVLRSAADSSPPAGDVLFMLLSDEEVGGEDGAQFVTNAHGDLLKGVRYAIGEFGGFTLHVGKQRFYPIQVGEKQLCRLRATVRGPGGHGSLVHRGGTMSRLAGFLARLDRSPLPMHVTPIARECLVRMGAAFGMPPGLTRALLRNEPLMSRALQSLGGLQETFEPMLRNTVNATIIHGGANINVIPSEVVVELDGRVLPGFGPEELLQELQALVGPDVELEVLRHDPGPAEPDMGLFPALTRILQEADPEGIPIPMLLPGVTDARFLSRLGIQTYGFLPMNLPPDFRFTETIHAADERIPVKALEFGADVLTALLRQFPTRAAL